MFIVDKLENMKNQNVQEGKKAFLGLLHKEFYWALLIAYTQIIYTINILCISHMQKLRSHYKYDLILMAEYLFNNFCTLKRLTVFNYYKQNWNEHPLYAFLLICSNISLKRELDMKLLNMYEQFNNIWNNGKAL